jgi:hypothetical protein
MHRERVVSERHTVYRNGARPERAVQPDVRKYCSLTRGLLWFELC